MEPGTGLAGLENLSLIPGTVGAAPMQNIGAYGVELKDVFDSLTALDRQDGTLREFDRQACRFGYRDSLFKQEPDRWLILRVRLRLTRRERLHLDYGPVRQRLEEEGHRQSDGQGRKPGNLRHSPGKAARPRRIGQCRQLLQEPAGGCGAGRTLASGLPGSGRLSAGGRSAEAGCRLAHRQGRLEGFPRWPGGVHAQQALVLVNHGGATGAQVRALAERIQEDVRRRFGVGGA